MNNLVREIYTKALLAKGNKTTLFTYRMTLEHPCETILGCWIIDHQHTAKIMEGKTYSVGSYDIHLWYSYENTKSTVFVNKLTYCDELPLDKIDNRIVNESDEPVSICLQEPKCLKATIVDGNEIEVELEKSMGVNIVGETIIKIELRDDINQINTEFIK